MALLIRPATTCATDKRADEIRQLAAEEGITLRMSIDMILWFEDRGYVVDLVTGVAMKAEVTAVTRTGRTINHLMTPAHPEGSRTVTDADVDALIEEVYGKPGLGVQDSAGLSDVDDCVGNAYELGKADYADGRYVPPFATAEHDAYIRGYNDAWATAKKVTWWRRGQR